MAVQNEMLQEGRSVPLTKLCLWLELPRSTAYYQPQQRSAPARAHAFEMLVFDIVQEHPTFGIRRVWALLKFSLVGREQETCRASVQAARLVVQAMSYTRTPACAGIAVGHAAPGRTLGHRYCAGLVRRKAWLVLVRSGPRLLHAPGTGLGTGSDRASQNCRTRIGICAAATVRLDPRRACRYADPTRQRPGLRLETVPPRRQRLWPEAGYAVHAGTNGLAERFIRSLKEECVWQNNFESIEHARATIAKWINWYNHQSLNYKTPDAVHA